MAARVYRNHYRHLVGVWVVAALPMALTAFGLPRIAGRLPTVLGVLLIAIAVSVGIAWLVEPIWAARYRTLTVSGDDVTLRMGKFTPEIKTAARKEITAVQVERSLANKVTGLWSVEIFTHGVAEAAMKMPAVSHGDALELGTLMQDYDESASASSEAPKTEPTTTTLYRASRSDVVVTALSNGVPIAIAVGLIGFALDLSDFTGQEIWTSPLVIIGVGVIIAVGVAWVTALKFTDYTIERGERDELTIRYGSVDSVKHTLSAKNQLVLTAHRSLIDILSGKVTLRYSHSSTDGSGSKRVAFPSMSPAALERTVAVIDPRATGLAVPRARLSWVVAQLCVFVAGIAAGLFALNNSQHWLAGAAVVVTLLTAQGIRFASRRMSQSEHPDLLQLHTAGLSHEVTLVPHHTISMATSWRPPALTVRVVTVSGWSHGRVKLSFVSRTGAMFDTVAAHT